MFSFLAGSETTSGQSGPGEGRITAWCAEHRGLAGECEGLCGQGCRACGCIMGALDARGVYTLFGVDDTPGSCHLIMHSPFGTSRRKAHDLGHD